MILNEMINDKYAKKIMMFRNFSFRYSNLCWKNVEIYYRRANKFAPITFLQPARKNHSNFPDVADVEIQVPWGIIAARHWNGYDSSRKPVLCLHGWKDNSASFDAILPMLATQLPQHQFLAIDYAGHGYSSHYPPGMLYQMNDILVLIGRIINIYKWDKITIIGHSLGAIVGFLYTATHNKGSVEKLVAIDALTPIVFEQHDILDMIPKIITDTIELERKYHSGKPTLYTYDSLLNRYLQSHLGGLDKKTCKALMSRGMKETYEGSGKYYLTHDIRLRYLTFMTVSPLQIKCLAKNFRTPLFYIIAEEGVRYSGIIEEHLEEWLKMYNEHKDKVIFKRFPGPHHLHITKANEIAPEIIKFLKS